jgi:hypothetical protein
MTPGAQNATLPSKQKTTEERFKAFHQEHPEVYEYIVSKAREWKFEHRPPYEHGSISDIIGRARYDLHMKISGSYNTFYADLAMSQEQDLKGFFRRIKHRQRTQTRRGAA